MSAGFVKSVKCLIRGHSLSYGMYKNPFNLEFLFVYVGKYAICDCCGKIVDIHDDSKIPMLQPLERK